MYEMKASILTKGLSSRAYTVALIRGWEPAVESRAKSIGCVSLGAMSPTPVDSGSKTAPVMIGAGVVVEVSSNFSVDTSVGCRSKLVPLETDVMLILELELELEVELEVVELDIVVDVEDELVDELIEEEVEDVEDEVLEVIDNETETDVDEDIEDDDLDELEITPALTQLPASSLMLENVYDEPMV